MWRRASVLVTVALSSCTHDAGTREVSAVFRLPKDTFCVGEPIDVKLPLEDPRPYQLRLAAALADLAEWTSQWANGPRRAPFTVATE